MSCLVEPLVSLGGVLVSQILYVLCNFQISFEGFQVILRVVLGGACFYVEWFKIMSTFGLEADLWRYWGVENIFGL